NWRTPLPPILTSAVVRRHSSSPTEFGETGGGYDISATPDRYLASESIRPPSRQIWTLKDPVCDAGHRPEENGVGKTARIAHNNAPFTWRIATIGSVR